MKKITTVLLTSLLIFGTAACSNLNKTSANTLNQADVNGNPSAGTETGKDLGDALSSIRRRQLEEDIQAREQRNNFFNSDSAKDGYDSDLESEVRDKLELYYPSSKLAVESQKGIVSIKGTVTTRKQLARIKSLAKEVEGVSNVKVEAHVGNRY